METEQKKSRMNKKVIIPVLAVLLIGCVIATATGVYFWNTDVTLSVKDGRNSTDMPVTLNCFSGETETWTTTIRNDANVDLKAQLVFEEVSNPDGVIYTTTAPIIVDLKKASDDTPSITTQDVSITCDEITPTGIVTGTLHYAPYKAT